MKKNLKDALEKVLFRESGWWHFETHLVSLLGYYSPDEGLPEEIQNESEKFQRMVAVFRKRDYVIDCLKSTVVEDNSDMAKLIRDMGTNDPSDQPDVVKLVAYVRLRAQHAGDLDYLNNVAPQKKERAI